MNDLRDLREITRRFLDRDKARVFGQFEATAHVEIDGRATRHVVKHDRQVTGIGDGAEMRDHGPLRRLVVHRRDVQQVRSADRFHLARRGDRALRIVRPGTGDDWHPPVDLLDRDLDHTTMLRWR